MNANGSSANAAPKRLRISGVVAIASMMAVLSGPATAANFEPYPTATRVDVGNEVEYVDLTGPIETGDATKFADLLSELGVAQYSMTGVDGLELKLRLDSPGGSLSEAIEIARLVDNSKIQTFIAQGSECLSACAVIFMAGTVQWGFRAPEERWRKVEWPAKLGFHRPFIGNLTIDIPQEALSQLNADELEEIFNEQFSHAFDTANELIQEMLRVDPTAWRPELLVRMLTATAGNADGDFVYLETVDDALMWDIDIANAVPPESSSKKESFTENFWLCYNSGRAIPAYSGIWPDKAVRLGTMESAEESLELELSELSRVQSGGEPSARWGGAIEDDGLTYHTRVRGWIYGCTIRYENAGADPVVTFAHDDSTVTQTTTLQHYNPNLSLDEVVRD